MRLGGASNSTTTHEEVVVKTSRDAGSSLAASTKELIVEVNRLDPPGRDNQLVLSGFFIFKN